MEELRGYLDGLFKECDGETIALDHPRFAEFHGRLAYALRTPANCQHDYRHARLVLQEMGMNEAASLAYCRQHGGYCDCEILFNVIPAGTDG